MKTKEAVRAEDKREKNRVRSMLEGYNPWGRPGGGAPATEDHSEFWILENRDRYGSEIYASEIYASEIYASVNKIDGQWNEIYASENKIDGVSNETLNGSHNNWRQMITKHKRMLSEKFFTHVCVQMLSTLDSALKTPI